MILIAAAVALLTVGWVSSQPAPPAKCAGFSPGRLDQLGFDIFEVHRITGNYTLACVGYNIFKERNLFGSLNLDPMKVYNFLNGLETKYVAKNPYHNNVHGADVLQMSYALLSLPRLQGAFTEVEWLATLLAAAGHDVEHPGLNNNYLNRTDHPWAVKYERKSILENHHLAVTLAQLGQSDLITHLTQAQKKQIEDLITLLILATDMAKHRDATTSLQALADAKGATTGLLRFTEAEKKLVLELIIHLSDISNPTKPLSVYQEWSRRVMEEFWQQGDKEREHGLLPLSALCDRQKDKLPQSQVGFTDFVVRPFWSLWAKLVKPDAQVLMDQIEANYVYYKSQAI